MQVKVVIGDRRSSLTTRKCKMPRNSDSTHMHFKYVCYFKYIP